MAHSLSPSVHTHDKDEWTDCGSKVGNSESVDSDSISRLDSSLDSSRLQLAIYT